MKVGDIVEIGWNGPKKRPFIGIVTDVSKWCKCCWVYVNGTFQWCPFDSITRL